MDAKQERGQQALIARLNEACAGLARSVADVSVVDYAALVGRHGSANWYDARMRHYARAPIAGPMQPFLVAEYMKFLRAQTGLARKCLVLDLDNTLWGGVLGEDGPAGVALGATYPGSAFVEFQRHLLDLHARGVILAIASKNNAADVDEMFASSQSMLLGPGHFSAREVHWRPKSESLRAIARVLNIGLEHIVFFDDSAAEREEVRRALPAVTVIDVPTQPERYAEALLQEGLFDTLGLSAEDRRRGELYKQRSEAEAMRGKVGSVEDYYRDLRMEVTVLPVDAASLSRTAQLTQKTNQFNVTTRRYTEAEVARRASDPDWVVATIGVRDRFGDNGIVGVVMAQKHGSALDIDTVLLSCRVIGRTIETAMLAHLCERARSLGADSLAGTVVPTAKNEPARELFAQHGFAQSDVAADGTTRWRLDLSHATVAWPEWLQGNATAAPQGKSANASAKEAAGAGVES
jgi:FkbH-like protein